MLPIVELERAEGEGQDPNALDVSVNFAVAVNYIRGLPRETRLQFYSGDSSCWSHVFPERAADMVDDELSRFPGFSYVSADHRTSVVRASRRSSLGGGRWRENVIDFDVVSGSQIVPGRVILSPGSLGGCRVVYHERLPSRVGEVIRRLVG